jgi:hypothetical protein
MYVCEVIEIQFHRSMHFPVRSWTQVSDSASFKRLEIAQVQSIRELRVPIGIISYWLLMVCHSLPRVEAHGERTTLHDVCGWVSTNPFDSERVRKLIVGSDFESPSHPHTRSRERNWVWVRVILALNDPDAHLESKRCC